MLLYTGNTFNEEVVLLEKIGIDTSQYTVTVTSDVAEVYMINELEFRNKMKPKETLDQLVVFMKNKAKNLQQQLKARPTWSLKPECNYAIFYKKAFMFRVQIP